MKIKTYSVQAKWIEGTKIETKIRDFKVNMDEPLELKGTNTAPNPVELLLAALGACVILNYRAYAKKFGINIEDLTMNLEGDIVSGGWHDEQDRVRKGFKQIRYEVKIKADAPEEKVQQLRDLVEKKCAVGDMLINQTEIETKINMLKTTPQSIG